MNNSDKINQNLSQDKFNFVQKGQKLYDQKIEGKPIGFLQDVWMRFRKNKTNVNASIILVTLLIFALIMPGLSGKEYVKIDEKLSFLPPRVPVLESIGLFDGKVDKENVPVDLSNYNEEFDVYYPIDDNPVAVELESLTNTIVPSNEKSEYVLNGQSVMALDPGSNSMTVESTDFMAISFANNGYVEVDVFELNGGSIDVLLKTDFAGDPKVVYTITEPGKHQIKPFELDEELYADIASRVRLAYNSDSDTGSAAITSIAVYDDSSEEPISFSDGYALSAFAIVDGSGKYQRQNGELIVASYKYNKYLAVFDITHEIAFSSEEYDALLEEYGDDVEIIENPDNPEGWYFSEGFPIKEVIRKNDSVVVDGESYSSYEVYLDYGKYLGYEKLPYFLFGTTQAGRDLFSLVWVGLRTSLFLGLIVTFINVSIGVVYGAISGFYGGTVDLLMQRFAEIMGRIPWLVALAIVTVFLGPGFLTLLLVMVISGWISTASVTRMQFYRYKGREYVLAAKTLGARDRRLIFRHILPNGIGTIITSSILSIPGVIFTEAALSFLGFGIGHGQSFNIFGLEFSGVSIGVLMSDGRNFLSTYPYLTVYPALIVSILMITFNMFGNALRDAFNPSLRGVE